MKKTGECLLCRNVITFILGLIMPTYFNHKKMEEIFKIDLESKNQGIMKIITSTKFTKVREKI